MTETPSTSKPWYQSATIYAIALSITTKILIVAGVGGEDIQKTAAELTTLWLPLAGIAFDLAAAWFRKRATGPLTITTPKETPDATPTP